MITKAVEHEILLSKFASIQYWEQQKKNPHFTESYRRFLRYKQKKITVHVEFDTLNRQIGKEKESPYMLNLTALIAKSAKKRLS